MSCLRATFSLEDRGWSFPSCRRLRDNVSFVPTQAWEVCRTIPLRSILVTQVGGEHLDSISSWLGSSSYICSPKVSINS